MATIILMAYTSMLTTVNGGWSYGRVIVLDREGGTVCVVVGGGRKKQLSIYFFSFRTVLYVYILSFSISLYLYGGGSKNVQHVGSCKCHSSRKISSPSNDDLQKWFIEYSDIACLQLINIMIYIRLLNYIMHSWLY